MNATLETRAWEKLNDTRLGRKRSDLGEEVYEFIEAIKEELPISETEMETTYCVNVFAVDLKNYTNRELIDCIEQYEFESLAQVKATYGESYKKVIAEWLFTDVNMLDKQMVRGLEQWQAIDTFKTVFNLDIEF